MTVLRQISDHLFCDKLTGILKQHHSKIWSIFCQKGPVTHLLILDKDVDLETIFSMRIAGNPPYIYVIIQEGEEIFDLREVQFYSQKSIWISTWNEKTNELTMSDDNWYQRRLNFNGANLNISFSLTFDIEIELFSLFQNKFNFTTKEKDFQGYGGILEDGTRTGSVGEVINGNLDLGTYN